jgi:hypothetical protein
VGKDACDHSLATLDNRTLEKARLRLCLLNVSNLGVWAQCDEHQRRAIAPQGMSLDVVTAVLNVDLDVGAEISRQVHPAPGDLVRTGLALDLVTTEQTHKDDVAVAAIRQDLIH